MSIEFCGSFNHSFVLLDYDEVQVAINNLYNAHTLMTSTTNTNETPTPKISRILLLDHSKGCDHAEDIETPTKTRSPRKPTQPIHRDSLWATSCSITDPALNRPCGYVAYLCTVEIPQDVDDPESFNSHAIRRRYSDFVRLRARLRSEFPKVYTPHLPPKSYAMSQTSNARFLEQRRGGLELFLRSVVLNPEIGGSQTVRDWFEVTI